jgi:bifunctional UDP-N-acetylglucosamine pyrophosphorylase/glucosamine-1-phosphate N-acetyltransferase
MKAELLEAGRLAACEPLTCTRELGACPVANRPLAAVQRERLIRTGLELANHLAEGLFVRGDAWLSDAALATCAARPGSWSLRDSRADLLAWTGSRHGASAGASSIQADSDSFRIRYPWDLLRVNEQLLAALTESRIEGDVHPAAHIEGFLLLGPRSRILPGVYLEGNVAIGADCKIGPNCYIRGATSIGDHCHIGQAVEVKNSIVMAHTHIAHLSYCGDSILGEAVNFGAGTISANFRHDGKNHRSNVGGVLVDTGLRKLGTIVGDGVHTGIHTSIYPGRKIWPGLTTRPGAVVQKDLTVT